MERQQVGEQRARPSGSRQPQLLSVFAPSLALLGMLMIIAFFASSIANAHTNIGVGVQYAEAFSTTTTAAAPPARTPTAPSLAFANHQRTAATTSSSALFMSTAAATASPSATTVVADRPLGKDVTHPHCKETGDRDILVRAARGERTERTPVWLMRQAGRYMAAFRQYSNTIPFRERSETVDYACELSLQCHRAYGMDGIIMFSDILTPLPCLGIDFDVVKGVGPIISTPIRTEADVNVLPNHSFEDKVPFIGNILNRLSKEAAEANTSLIGFVGAPFTLASYTIEGKSSKHCLTTKQLMMEDEIGTNTCISSFLDKVATMIGDYGIYQISQGAEVIQVFDSWAHQISPKWFEQYAKPAAIKAAQRIKAAYPDVPIIYFANGGSSYLELQKDMAVVNGGPYDMICLDWAVDMKHARTTLGADVPVSGNLDPTVLFGTQSQIEQAVRDCIDKAGGPGNRHLLNLGHGVMQGTPEIAVKWLIDECKRYRA